MPRYLVRDPATREFEIEESAIPFWEHREGHTIVGPVLAADDKPAAGDAPSGSAQPAPGEPAPPEESGPPVESSPDKSPTTPKTSTNPGKIVDK